MVALKSDTWIDGMKWPRDFFDKLLRPNIDVRIISSTITAGKTRCTSVRE